MMDRKDYPRFVFLLTLLLLFSACEASQSSYSKQEIWQEYTEIYKQYQQDLYHFGSKRWPEYTSVLKAQLQYERARLKLRTMRFQFLLEEHPSRLETNNIHEFVHFQWSDKDRKHLHSRNPEAQKQFKIVQKRKKQHFDHPKWPELRKKFQSLPEDNRYHQIQKQFQQQLNELDRLQ